MDNVAAGGNEICSSGTQYIDFALIHFDNKGRLSYMHSDASFNLFINESAGVGLKLTSTTLSASGNKFQAIQTLTFMVMEGF